MFHQNAKIALRYGEQAESILPDWTAATSLDLCWDKEWECLLTLDWVEDHLTVTAFLPRTKQRIVHPFPKYMLYGSRLFRYQNSICLRAGDPGRQGKEALLRIPRLGVPVAVQSFPKGTDMDNTLAPEMTKKRRAVLMELRKNVPLTVIDAVGGSLSDMEEQIPLYPVVVGYPGESDIRFSPTGRSIAIGSINHLVAAWLVGSAWQTRNFKKEIYKELERTSKKLPGFRTYNAFANDRYVTFGIESYDKPQSRFLTLVVELKGNQARVHRIYKSMYAPPIRTVE